MIQFKDEHSKIDLTDSGLEVVNGKVIAIGSADGNLSYEIKED